LPGGERFVHAARAIAQQIERDVSKAVFPQGFVDPFPILRRHQTRHSSVVGFDTRQLRKMEKWGQITISTTANFVILFAVI
jgi:hypothetical protein